LRVGGKAPGGSAVTFSVTLPVVPLLRRVASVTELSCPWKTCGESGARESVREPLGELEELMLPPPQPTEKDSKTKSGNANAEIF